MKGVRINPGWLPPIDGREISSPKRTEAMHVADPPGAPEAADNMVALLADEGVSHFLSIQAPIRLRCRRRLPQRVRQAVPGRRRCSVCTRAWRSRRPSVTT